MKKLFSVLACCFLVSCTEETNSRKALESQGFTDVNFQGYAFFGCGDDDSYRTKFTAKNPRGQQVSGVVCCGFLKACTVRF